MSHASLNATVVRKTILRDGLFSICVAHNTNPPAPNFIAGQYAVLGLPLPENALDLSAEGERRRPPRVGGIMRRSYSIASAPSERNHVEFYVVRVDKGHVSPQLGNLKVGDSLYMSERFQGRLCLSNAVCENGELPDIVMLATGTGLAPFISMLRETQHEQTQGGKARWRKCVLLHGVREAEDLGYQEELQSLAKRDTSFVYVPSLTRASDPWQGRRGRLQTAFEDDTLKQLGLDLHPQNTHVFLCGAPGMIDETEALLLPRGFKLWKPKDCGNLHLERFW